MSADPTDLLKQTARLSEEVTRPFMNSRKIIRTGSRGDIRVAMREVDQTATPAEGGSAFLPYGGRGVLAAQSINLPCRRSSVMSWRPTRSCAPARPPLSLQPNTGPVRH